MNLQPLPMSVSMMQLIIINLVLPVYIGHNKVCSLATRRLIASHR